MILKTAGSTDQSIDVYIQDETGQPMILAYNAEGLVCYYRRGGNGPLVQIALASLADCEAAHADGGFVAVGANMPGLHRLDLPDAVLAIGVDQVSIELSGADNMGPCPARINLMDGGRPEVNLKEIGDSEALLDLFAEGLGLIYGGTVTDATEAPTASVFRVTGLDPDDFPNLPGRPVYFRGISNLRGARSFVTNITYEEADEEYEVTVSPALRAAPANGSIMRVQ